MTDKPTKLTPDDRIPAHTECPWEHHCDQAVDGSCYHAGSLHRTDYLCETAIRYNTHHMTGLLPNPRNRRYLYLVTRISTGGYDSYDGFVVCAPNARVARWTRPNSHSWDDSDRRDDAWVKSPEDVEVTLLGVAAPEVSGGIILSSFRAG